MGTDQDEIRAAIAQTRERMGDTIEALGYKADVKTRARESIGGKVDTMKDKLGLTAERVSDITPEGDEVKQQARRAVGMAQENPLGLAVGAIAAGFLVGLVIPSSKMEDERIGPVADQLKDQAKQTGQEALERGKQVAQSAAETARDEAQQHGQELAESAQQRVGSEQRR
jgi:hypothetical protein